MPLDCDTVSDAERLASMRRYAVEHAVPLQGSIALTHRCNLRCVHCYALERHNSQRPELSTTEILDAMREAADAGCLSVLLTGGEPLLRPDFSEIYLGLRRLGLYVTLFTNGTLVTPAIVSSLAKAPPSLIEISVYGSSPATYERITGSAKAYEQAWHGIGLLREAGFSVRLKTPLMTLNKNDFAVLREQGSHASRDFRFDPVIIPRFTGDDVIGALRIPTEEVAALEASVMPELISQWEQKIERQTTSLTSKNDSKTTKPLYTCAAGVVSFYISADSWIQPCVCTTDYRADIRRLGMMEAWLNVRAAIHKPQANPGYPCSDCSLHVFCASCPATSKIETGSEHSVPEYACRLAQARARKIGLLIEKLKQQ